MEPMKPMAPMKPFEPMKPMTFDPPWWPEQLGQPSSSGAQNDMRYAFFPEKRRLLIERQGKRTIYDTGTHRISGVSQQSSHDRSPAFTSQHGPLHLDDLQVVEPAEGTPSANRQEEPSHAEPSHAEPSQQQSQRNEPRRAEQQRHDSLRGDVGAGDPGRARPPETGAHERRDLAPPQHPASIQALASSKGDAPGGERVVFTEEGGASRYLKLIASGDIDADMLEALEDFIKRQKRRLAKS